MQKKTTQYHRTLLANIFLLPILLSACIPSFKDTTSTASSSSLNLSNLKHEFKTWVQDLLLEEATADAFINSNRTEISLHVSPPAKLENPSGLALFDEKNGLTIRSSFPPQQTDSKITLKFGIEIPKGNYIVKWDKVTFKGTKAGESAPIQTNDLDFDNNTASALASVKDLNILKVDIGHYQPTNALKHIFVVDKDHNVIANTLRLEVQEDGIVIIYLSQMLTEGEYRVVFSKNSLADENGKVLSEQIISNSINISVLLADASFITESHGERPEMPISSELNNKETMLLIGTGSIDLQIL